MKWALIAGGVIVSLIVLVVVVGALLPRDHVATVSARIAATPDAVWEMITDVANHPSWRSDVQRVEVLPSTATGASWREHSKNGALTMVVDRADAPRHLTTRIADTGLPFGGQWEYVIEPEGTNASRVTITERGSVYNPVFRFVSRFIMGHTATIDTYLRSLGRKFGDEPTPVVVASTH
jgi:uncharacterized protein YndB with AHSA1/START domain